MNNAKVLLLDLSGVVFRGPSKGSKLIDWKIIRELNKIYAHDLNIGIDVFPNFLADYYERNNSTLDKRTFFDELFNTIEFNKELIQFTKAHFRIIITSDNYKENINYINERYQLDLWTEAQFYSFDFNITKEDPEFFQQLLDVLDIHSDQIVFLDDSISKIEAARMTGIKGIHYKNNESSIKKLS